jgi:hypothetical protein
VCKAAIAACSWYGPGERRPVAVPHRAVLVLEQDQFAVGARTSLAPRVLQQQECEQAERLRLVRHQHRQELRQSDRLVAQFAAHERIAGRGRVALVEDEVEDGEHRA